MSGDGDADPEVRGWVARQMLAQDARWAMDVVLSSEKHADLAPYVGLLLGHHFVRIAYEGAVTLRSDDDHVGLPQLAELLRDQFAPITARVRHVTKLLDDTKKTYEVVVDEFESIVLEHRRNLMGNAVRWARWLETDLGVYVADGRPVGATVPTAYRLGLRFTADGAIDTSDVRAMSEEWGSMLMVLGAAALDRVEPMATLDLSSIPEIRGRDRRSDRYLARRFERDFPIGLKMLLLAIEGDLNTLTTLVAPTAHGHLEATFRVRTVTLFHSLSTLRRILQRYGGRSTPGLNELRDLIEDPTVDRLLSSPGRLVRNRCMHYEIPARGLKLDPTTPMFGIVEAICEGTTMAEFAAYVDKTIVRVTQLLDEWSPRDTRWN